MKEKVLDFLLSQKGKYISGEEISQALAVSRTAVWKQIKQLRTEGYEIQSSSRLGYRLVSQPDLLLPQEIRQGLSTQWLGKEIHYYASLDSTNILAKKLAAQGAPEGALILAEEQTGGKGRLGRQWISPFAKGLWFSLILRPEITPTDAPKIVMLAAAALQETVASLTGLSVKIKWPNDLLLEQKKVAGILVEMSGEMDNINYLVVGIGINVNLTLEDFSPELRETATSLAIGLEKKVNRLDLLQALLAKFEEYYSIFKAGNYAFLVAKWREASCTLGQLVRVTTIREVLEGRAIDFTDDGSLVLELEDGSFREIVAGDVTLR